MVGEIEAWGRSIERIVAACKNAGCPIPEFRYDGDEVWTIFKFKSVEKTVEKSVEKSVEKNKKTLKTTEIIIEMMTDNPFVTAEEIVGRTGLTRRCVEENIKKLKNNGIIKREGPDKGGKWLL